ncbi:hypothetical protein F5876DRAFT_71989 [Lentinula aff. lateritia]|uniref:Uncharacterized protein n=1 Tax=Lentinula aff. lateritia TaxID=2804960 RepID=A0ACC1UEM0_9AGAR|nr:hypothetical protein F5876DRAFT_71989 [Lentinula aff. lateritia]
MTESKQHRNSEFLSRPPSIQPQQVPPGANTIYDTSPSPVEVMNHETTSKSKEPPEFRRINSDLEGGNVTLQSYPKKLGRLSKLSSILSTDSLTRSTPRKGSDATLVGDDSGEQDKYTSFKRNQTRRRLSLKSGIPSVPVLSVLHSARQPSVITKHLEGQDPYIQIRQKFLLKLSKALLSFGAPSHRISSQLAAAAEILGAEAEFVHLPNIIIASMKSSPNSPSARTYFVRATGAVALTSLHQVHIVYRDVLHDKIGAEEGTQALRKLLREHPIYPLYFRCILAFFGASTICATSFGGSFLDIWISGFCACVLQYLGLNAAHKSAMYANVYEISVSIIVAFVARALSNIPGNWFCYSAISSAGVVLILPGFTILVSALELMSKNLFCGSVRIVYAVIYTLFLGFGLTIGSDFYLVVDRRARKAYYVNSTPTNLTYTHGRFVMANGSIPFIPIQGVLGQANALNYEQQHLVKGCFRDPSWQWFKQPFPWWTLLLLVPLYSTLSSLGNLQRVRSVQLLVMVLFSCCSYAANKGASVVLPGRTDIVSAVGAFVIGLLGNLYSRVIGGTAFTSMVTGVLYLVPSGIAQGGGVTQTYRSSADQYSSGFSLALRMISVASGVTIGLFVSQLLVYLFGTRKNAAHFAF